MRYRSSCLQGAVYSLTRFLFCFLSDSTGHMWTIFIPCILIASQGQSSLCWPKRSTAWTNCDPPPFLSFFLFLNAVFWLRRIERSRAVRGCFISHYHFPHEPFPGPDKTSACSGVRNRAFPNNSIFKKWLESRGGHRRRFITSRFVSTFIFIKLGWSCCSNERKYVCVKISGWDFFFLPQLFFLFPCP